MADLRRLLAVVGAGLVLAVAPAGAAADDEAERAGAGPAADAGPGPFAAADYLRMWDDAALPGLVRADPAVFDAFVGITGDTDLDARIRDLAAARGYTRQLFAAADLVAVDGRRLQAPAAEAWLALKAAARADGVPIALTSAWRSPREQRAVFLDRLGDRSDAGIDAALRASAPPGFSKHQTGFAIDVGQPGADRAGFVNTRAYAWLSADDFSVPRSLGWIPSYPEGGEDMGPDPEPWELVWVGAGRIDCARVPDPARGFCDVAASDHGDDIVWLADLGVTVGCRPGRYCTDDPITRGEAAALAWRLHGAPPAVATAPFDDVFATDSFAPAVDWLWSEGLVVGMSTRMFGPTESLAADHALALILRLSVRDDLPAPHGILGPLPDFAGPGPEGRDVGPFISRAEFASILRNFAVGR